jgi:two-component system sensor kinase FixL
LNDFTAKLLSGQFVKEEKNNNKQGIMSTEAHLKAVLETVIDGIITISRKGIIQTVNPAAEHIFGYSAMEMAGENVNMLMPAPYAGEHDGYLHNYLTTGDKKVIGIGREVTGKRKDDSTFPMELAVSEMEVNGERMFTGIVRDITERKRSEYDINAREQRIRTLIDTIVDGIVVIDAQGRIETFNPSAETLFGYNTAEV